MVSKVLTIIIPVFNGEKHIYRALECLKNQTWKNFSVLIINDNSTDNSVDIIKQYKENHYYL